MMPAEQSHAGYARDRKFERVGMKRVVQGQMTVSQPTQSESMSNGPAPSSNSGNHDG
jgi:hypothetical protein